MIQYTGEPDIRNFQIVAQAFQHGFGYVRELSAAVFQQSASRNTTVVPVSEVSREHLIYYTFAHPEADYQPRMRLKSYFSGSGKYFLAAS